MNNILEFKKELETALDVYKKAKIFLKENEETARDDGSSIFSWAVKESSDIMESLIGWWRYLSRHKKEVFETVGLKEKLKILSWNNLIDVLDKDTDYYTEPTQEEEEKGYLWKESRNIMSWFDDFGSFLENSLTHIRENAKEKVIVGEFKHQDGTLENFLIRNIDDFINLNKKNSFTFPTPITPEKITIYEIPLNIDFDINPLDITDEKELKKISQKHKLKSKSIEWSENILVEVCKVLEVKDFLLELTKKSNSFMWDIYELKQLKRKIFYTNHNIEEEISKLIKTLLGIEREISTLKDVFKKPLKTTIENVEKFEKKQYDLLRKKRLEDATRELEQLKTTQGKLKITDLKKTIEEQEGRVCRLTNRMDKIKVQKQKKIKEKSR